VEQIPIDRILYGGNYPYENRGKSLMEELKESGIIGSEEWEMIAWGNAEKLFGVRGGARKKGQGAEVSRRASFG
jgi:predicted TIM-barrel fold metal-dependent hydrolase